MAILFIYLRVLRLDGQCSPFGHRIPRVQAKIHQRLLDLGRINQCDFQLRILENSDFKLGSDQPVKQLHSLVDQGVQIHPSRLQHLPARKG